MTPEWRARWPPREGAKAVVTGEISALGKSYVLVGADAQRRRRQRAGGAAGDGRRRRRQIVVRSTGSRQGAGADRRVAHRPSAADEPLEQVTTGSLEALRLYTEGVAAQRPGRERAGDQLLRAGHRAGQRLCHGLAQARGGAGATPAASQDRVVAATTQAWEHRDRLTEIERQLAIAFYYTPSRC